MEHAEHFLNTLVKYAETLYLGTFCCDSGVRTIPITRIGSNNYSVCINIQHTLIFSMGSVAAPVRPEAG